MVKHDLNIISFNARGLQNSQKRLSVFKYLKRNECDVAFLQETYSRKEDEVKWVQQWDGCGWFVHGTNHSKGVAILFKKHLGVKIVSKKLDSKGRFVILKCVIREIEMNLINIYAPNKEKEQVSFLEDLMHVLQAENILNADNNIFAGDWNIVLNNHMDKQGGIDNPKRTSIQKIDEIKQLYNLVDVWRLKNANTKRYTWRQKQPRVHCRLDYFLISSHLLDYLLETKILPSVLSDHSPISLSFKFIEEPKQGPGHWKLNLSLLEDETYKTKMKENIADWIRSYENIQDENLKWELIKYEIRSFSIKYSKSKQRAKRDRKLILEAKVLELERQESVLDENIYKKLDDLKTELNAMHIEEAQGSIIRSRARWSEEGEKSTAYFFNLEKHNSIKKHIRKIVKDDKEIIDQAEILNAIKSYYENMYKSDNCDLSDRELFSQPNTPKLSEHEKNLCEGPITENECTRILSLFAKNKTPGNDGLQIEFYIEFWEQLRSIIVKGFNYSFENGRLATSQRQAIISLLEKNGKDRLYIENWRPISLLNVDYKILSKCLAERVKKILDKLIDISQSGFVNGRNISDGMRTVLDTLEHTARSNTAGLLVTIDFQKAFDSLSWDFLFTALETYNFGTDFVAWVKLCYNDISSCVINYKISSQYFTIEKGVRQGDSLSPYLFILAVELMSIHIRNNKDIKGIMYNEKEIKILSYADDTTALLQSENDAKYLFIFLKEFEKQSGLKVNKSKTEGFWLGTNKLSNFKPLGIKWSSVIKILGIHISYDKDEMIQRNFVDKILKIKKRLNMWRQRDLTIFGKILILKTFAISQILYVASVLHVPEPILKEIDSIIFDFLWNGKAHKVKKKVVIQENELGGCRMVDLIEMLKVQKLKWISKIFDNNDYPWKETMKCILNVKDLKLVFLSNCLRPVNITEFYEDIIKFWSEIRHNEVTTPDDVINQCLWYNKKITINRNTLHSKSFVDKGIVQIKHILKDNGYFKTFNDLIMEYDIDKKFFLFYSGMIKCIPTTWKNIVKDQLIGNVEEQCWISIGGNKINFLKTNQKELYSQLIQCKSTTSKANSNYSRQFDISEAEWKTIYLLPFQLSVSNKARELQYKILHNYVASNKLLYKMNITASSRCNFCNLYTQDSQHLFFNCIQIRNLWFKIEEWLEKDLFILAKFGLKDILFGKQDVRNFDMDVVNKVILYGKMYIFNCKYNELDPDINKFVMYYMKWL